MGIRIQTILLTPNLNKEKKWVFLQKNWVKTLSCFYVFLKFPDQHFIEESRLLWNHGVK